MSEQNAATPYLQTPSQTIGPFFGYALPYEGGSEVVEPWRADAIRLHGVVYDGASEPIPDAMLELWGADADGSPIDRQGSLHREGCSVTGFGRAAVDRAGHYSFTTIRPGASEGRAPYLIVAVFARGLLHHLFTRAYLEDGDPFLEKVPMARRSTLLAVPDGERSYRFDIRMQGEGETVFLDFTEGRRD